MCDTDYALRCSCRPHLQDPSDVIIGWVAIAGVRKADGDGYTIAASSPDAPPDWMVRGMLSEVLSGLDAEVSQTYRGE